MKHFALLCGFSLYSLHRPHHFEASFNSKAMTGLHKLITDMGYECSQSKVLRETEAQRVTTAVPRSCVNSPVLEGTEGLLSLPPQTQHACANIHKEMMSFHIWNIKDTEIHPYKANSFQR